MTVVFRAVKPVISKAENRLSEMYGSKVFIRTLEFDAFSCPHDFELDNIRIDLY